MHTLRLGLLLVLTAALLAATSDYYGALATHATTRPTRTTARTGTIPAPRRPATVPKDLVPRPRRLAEVLADQRQRERNSDRELRQQQMIRAQTVEIRRQLAMGRRPTAAAMTSTRAQRRAR